MNPVYCVIISLGVWLELNMRTHPDAAMLPFVFAFTEDIMMPSAGQKANDMAQTIFGQRIFRRPEFQASGLLGSHSIRKFASTHVCNCGIFRRTTKTLEAVGRGRAEFQIVMTTWNCRTLISKLLKSCVLVVIAIIRLTLLFAARQFC
jgi:hypothetical protein